MQNGTGAVLEGGTTRYSVPQVARLLGISERAVRKRITAGTLDAERTPTGWLVVLEAVPTVPSAVPGAVPAEPSAALGGTVAVPVPLPDGELVAVREALAHAHDEVAFLRSQLEARDAELERRADEIARHQQLLLAALTSRPALEAHAVAVPEPPGAVPPVPHPWWARWAWWRHE
jgi:hypothetical protein